MQRHEADRHISAEAAQFALTTSEPGQAEKEAIEWYARLGGDEFFQRLCTTFYRLVVEDPELAPLFAGRTAEAHARRLATHFRRMYGQGDLSRAWDRRLLGAHIEVLISHDHRRRWLDCFTEAGARESAPEPLFTELVGLMLIASGDMMAASRGAAMVRGQEFDVRGVPPS